jgi:hypothetical protein
LALVMNVIPSSSIRSMRRWTTYKGQKKTYRLGVWKVSMNDSALRTSQWPMCRGTGPRV